MLILAADLHVRPNDGSRQRFREFLSWVSSTPHDIAFLGDGLDLWIGVSAYEDDLTEEFLAWCRNELAHRKIYLVEGNHEYFVVRHHRDAFTRAECDELPLGDLLLMHGDTCQKNASHLRFRWWVKSELAHILLHCPGAAAYVRHLKSKLERKSRARKHSFPQAELSAYATGRFEAENSPRTIIMGHFHHPLQEKRRNGRLFAVLPDWKRSGEIGLWNPASNELSIEKWRSVAKTDLQHSKTSKHRDK